jgi:PAS domain S-box-containing protein
VLCLAGAVILVRAVLRSPGLYRSQAAVLLVAVAVPWIGALIYLLPVNPFPGLDLVSLAFALSGVMLLMGMTRYRLFDLVPVARDVLVGRMTDGILVVDSADRIIDANPAALALLGIGKEAIGRRADAAMADLAVPLAKLAAGDQRVETTLPGSTVRHLEIGSSPLRDRWGRAAGRLLLVRDVTEKRLAEMEREKLIGELQAALADIKTLRGLLPICASCKKIRDDGGYWQHLEQYVSEHSEAQFSHSLCPDCLVKLYPELAGRMGSQAGPGNGNS